MFLACLLVLMLIAPRVTAGQPQTSSSPRDIELADASVDSSMAETIVDESLASPRATMFTFLDAMSKARDDSAALETAVDCLDLSKVNPERGQDLASKLLGVLNRLGEVRQSQLPQVSSATSYTYFPSPDHAWVRAQADPAGEIVLSRVKSGRWLFSADTVAGLDDLYDSLRHLKTRFGWDERQLSHSLWLEGFMPRTLRTDRVLTIKYWQWLGLVVLILLGVVIDHSVRFVLRLVSNRIIARRHLSAQPETITNTVRPLGLLAAGVFWLIGVRILGLPDGPLTVLLASIRIFTVLAATLAAWRVTDLICELLTVKAEKTATKFDDVLIPLGRKTAKIFVVVFGLIYGAAALSIPIVPMLTSLGIGGLAFAFAAKDTIENFFGSVAVILDRPFEVGDWVVIGDVEGTVEEVGFRSTRVRTFYNSQVTLPNATLVRATVDNYGRRRYRRVRTHIGVQYDTPPATILAFTEGIRELVRSHPYTRKDYYQVWLHEFGPSSLDILLYIFHEAPDWSTELRERERLYLDIIRLAEKLGVQFAFPTQTVHLFKEEHPTQSPTSPHEGPNYTSPSGSASEWQAFRNGIQAARGLVEHQPWRTTTPGPVQFEGRPAEIDDDAEDQIENRTAGG